MVGLRSSADGTTYCAGALIASEWVLTVMGCDPKEKSGFLNLGRTYKAKYLSQFTQEPIKVTQRIPHPDYNSDTRENDYLLLKLAQSFSHPVALAQDGTHYFVSGMSAAAYGLVSGDSSLLKTSMRHASDSCQATVGKVYASQFCAIDKILPNLQRQSRCGESSGSRRRGGACELQSRLRED